MADKPDAVQIKITAQTWALPKALQIATQKLRVFILSAVK